MEVPELKNINVYRIGFLSKKGNGELLFIERVFGFNPELTNQEIESILITRMGKITSIEYIDEIESDVMYW
ncbi:hypothetical protein LLW22_04100 [Enterococcus casseliflavus]|nr:hypothetical protein LLW22_04100 [Enterococcus casseliflavus]